MSTKISHRPHRQMSESFLTAGFLSLSGGLQDAYTYMSRGKVFANAQTGNIVLLSQSIGSGDWPLAIHYLVPLLSFALGVAAAELIRQTFQNIRKVHWRQLVLSIEIFLLFFVGFMPDRWNLMANAMVSFSCAMQVQAFRKVNGYGFASTMCIGNMRSAMESVCAYRITKSHKTLEKAVCYFGIILLFALGAGLGGYVLPAFGMRTIWFSCLLLLVSFSLMFIREEIDEHPELQQEAKAIAEEKNTDKEILKQEEKAFRKDLEKDIKKDIKEEIEDRILKK